eukprot:1685775-Rhodomonas_salina.5
MVDGCGYATGPICTTYGCAHPSSRGDTSPRHSLGWRAGLDDGDYEHQRIWKAPSSDNSV